MSQVDTAAVFCLAQEEKYDFLAHREPFEVWGPVWTRTHCPVLEGYKPLSCILRKSERKITMWRGAPYKGVSLGKQGDVRASLDASPGGLRAVGGVLGRGVGGEEGPGTYPGKTAEVASVPVGFRGVSACCVSCFSRFSGWFPKLTHKINTFSRAFEDSPSCFLGMTETERMFHNSCV